MKKLYEIRLWRDPGGLTETGHGVLHADGPVGMAWYPPWREVVKHLRLAFELPESTDVVWLCLFTEPGPNRLTLWYSGDTGPLPHCMFDVDLRVLSALNVPELTDFLAEHCNKPMGQHLYLEVYYRA